MVKTFNESEELKHTLTVSNDSLTPGTLIYFQYTAVNSVGESDLSSEVSYALASYPDAPTNVIKVDELSSVDSIYLQWDIVEDYEVNVIGYRVWMESDQNGQFVLVYDGQHYPGYNFYNATGLVTGSRYKFKVASLNSNGAGSLTTQYEFYSCLPPTDILPPVYISSTLTTMTLDWTHPVSLNGCPLQSF